jgi:hypothetical protein
LNTMCRTFFPDRRTPRFVKGLQRIGFDVDLTIDKGDFVVDCPLDGIFDGKFPTAVNTNSITNVH